MPANAKDILTRWEKLREEHRYWAPLWQEIADYIHPRRSSFTTRRSSGAKQTEKLFDSTAPKAHDRLASTLSGTLTSGAVQWFSLKLRDDTLNGAKEVRVWLEESAQRMFRAFNQSNFAQESNELYLDETALGTGAILAEERAPDAATFGGLQFTALPLHNLVIDEDSEGRVDTIMHCFEMSARNAAKKWGSGNLGDKIQKALEDGKDDQMFTFLCAIYPREDAIKNPDAATSKNRLPFALAYIAIADKHLIYESGFHEFPAMVPRWSKTSGEKYGRGPGHLALPDTKTLNKIKEISLKRDAKALDPPLKVRSDGVIGTPDMRPGKITTVENDMGAVEPLFPVGFFREASSSEQIKSAELRESIKDIFYDDLTQLPVGPQMTATEVVKRFELMQRRLGPTMGRQQTEFLNPLIERIFGIMYRRGALTEPPQVLLERGADIDVEYEGPLAKSQRLSQVEGIERLQVIVNNIAAVDPTVIDNINVDEAVRISADVLGAPDKILRSEREVQELRKARQAQQEEQQRKADMAQLAESAGKAAPALALIPGVGNGAAA